MLIKLILLLVGALHSAPGFAKEDVAVLPAAPILPITPVVVIDAGHTRNYLGTLGVKGIYEVAYNDNLVATLAKLLVDDGVKVILTRQPGQAMSLEKRAEIANSNQANLFLSIHHDSAQPVYLEQTRFNNLPANKTKQPIAGENRLLLNPTLGIYQFDDLIVLKHDHHSGSAVVEGWCDCR